MKDMNSPIQKEILKDYLKTEFPTGIPEDKINEIYEKIQRAFFMFSEDIIKNEIKEFMK